MGVGHTHVVRQGWHTHPFQEQILLLVYSFSGLYEVHGCVLTCRDDEQAGRVSTRQDVSNLPPYPRWAGCMGACSMLGW